MSEELDSDSLKSLLRERDDEFLRFADFALRLLDAFPSNGTSESKFKYVVSVFIGQ